MEYLEGQDLGSYVNDKGAVAEGVLLGWLEQMADAMDYAHGEKVVHRDIKPSNFFLTKKGQIKIMDFGIAKQEENMMGTRTDSKMGSVIYMSPEQIKSPKYLDYKTDIYSLGVALYHLSTGNIPYDIGTESEFEVMTSITQKPLPNLSDKNSRINAIIQAATQKDPKDRPNKVVDLLSVKPQMSDTTVIETSDTQKEKPQEVIVSDDTIIEQTENSEVENIPFVVKEDKSIVSKTEIKAATSEKENTIKTENKGINKAVLIIPAFLIVLGAWFFITKSQGKVKNNVRPEIITFKDSLSYSFGALLAEQIKPQLEDIDLKITTAGFREELSDKGQISMEQSQELYKVFNETKSNVSSEGSEAYLKQNASKKGIKTTSSGLQYKILKLGKGKYPTDESTVTVHYTGTLIDGTVFDSSVERGEPISFPLSDVIPGWTEGVQLINEGGKIELTIPYELGYGEKGSGPIPPKSVLIFEVELIDITS